VFLVYVIAKSTYEREVHICTIKACGALGDTTALPHIEVSCQPTSLTTCALSCIH